MRLRVNKKALVREAIHWLEDEARDEEKLRRHMRLAELDKQPQQRFTETVKSGLAIGMSDGQLYVLNELMDSYERLLQQRKELKAEVEQLGNLVRSATARVREAEDAEARAKFDLEEVRCLLPRIYDPDRMPSVDRKKEIRARVQRELKRMKKV